MAVRIRLRVQGKKDRAFYRIIVADSRLPRDGKYLEMLGWYNPFNEEKKAELNTERLSHWLSVGAQMSDKTRSIVKAIDPEIISKFLAKKPKKKKAKSSKAEAAAPKKVAKKAAKKAPAKKAKAASKTEEA